MLWVSMLPASGWGAALGLFQSMKETGHQLLLHVAAGFIASQAVD